MKPFVLNDDALSDLLRPLGNIRTAAKTINLFLDESGFHIPHSSPELSPFDAMNMADMIIRNVTKLEDTIGELEQREREMRTKKRKKKKRGDALSEPGKRLLMISDKNTISEVIQATEDQELLTQIIEILHKREVSQS